MDDSEYALAADGAVTRRGGSGATAAVAPEPPRRVTAPSAASAYSLSSTLSDRERAEYHYVERDLRNIGVLTVVLIGLLIGSWFLFNALGLIR